MAATNIKYKFKIADGLTGYRTDIGGNLNLNPVLRTHKDFTSTQIADILNAIDAEERTETLPCGESSDFSPRKLTFIRRNGRSFSVILPYRDKILTAATAIVNLFNSDPDTKIVCVELSGERTGNIVDLLVVNKPALVATDFIQPTNIDGYKAVYSSSMKEYASDVVYGNVRIQSFQSQTDVDDSPYSKLAAEINECVGELTTVSCGNRAEVFDYRRFVVSILTKKLLPDGTQDPQSPDFLQSITVPISKHLPADILECGGNIAENEFVACINYLGQSMRLNKFLNL